MKHMKSESKEETDSLIVKLEYIKKRETFVYW